MEYIKNQKIKEIINYKEIYQGINGNTAIGNFQLQFFTENIVKLQFSKNKNLFDFSYSAILSPQECETHIEEKNESIFLSTKNLKIILHKNDFHFSFYNNENELIQEDEKKLGISWIDNECTVYKALQKEERFLGLGEKVGNIDRKGMGFTNWNTDHYAYPANADPLYASIPFYIGVHNDLYYGIFLDSTAKSLFNFGASNNRFSSFSTEAGDMSYYFIYGKNVRQVIQEYTKLTGKMTMPPLWSLGYQQSRYSYYPDKEVKRIANTFREKNIPMDAINLDIHYMDQYKLFTWHKKDFTNPKALNSYLKSKNIHMVIIMDPGIKKEKGYLPYEDGMKKDVFIKYPDGSEYEGEVWPGWCHFPDFTNSKTREWWSLWMKELIDAGVEGFWSDMNEIATWGHFLPNNLVFDYEGKKVTTKLGRNVFALQMCRATFEACHKWKKNKRMFFLTRSGFAGIQRYSALWTGDNIASDEHMMLGVRLLQSIGMSGVAFCGFDIGGFSGDTTTKLYARWMSIASFVPFFRTHKMVNFALSNPWSFGEETLQIVKNYIFLRYRLLPYIYSTFYQAHKEGIPIMRSLAIDYNHKEEVFSYEFQEQFLFGDSFLIVPVESEKMITTMYLPTGVWYDFYNGEEYQGDKIHYVSCPLYRLPIFIPEGAIIPMQSQVYYMEETPEETLFIHIYFSHKKKNVFEYYEDDGTSFNYLQEDYFKRTITFNGEEKTLSFEEKRGNRESKFKFLKIYFHNFHDLKSIVENGKEYKTKKESIYFMESMPSFHPLMEGKKEEMIDLKCIKIENNPKNFSFKLLYS